VARLACATMAALTSAGSRYAGSCPGRSPVVTACSLPDLPPPTTPPSPAGLCVVVPHRSTPSRASRVRPLPAGSSFWQCRIVFTFVAVDLVLSVALHPASRRRGYFKFSPAQRWQMAGVSHPGGACSFTAHERGRPARRSRRPRLDHRSRCGVLLDVVHNHHRLVLRDFQRRRRKQRAGRPRSPLPARGNASAELR